MSTLAEADLGKNLLCCSTRSVKHAATDNQAWKPTEGENLSLINTTELSINIEVCQELESIFMPWQSFNLHCSSRHCMIGYCNQVSLQSKLYFLRESSYDQCTQRGAVCSVVSQTLLHQRLLYSPVCLTTSAPALLASCELTIL